MELADLRKEVHLLGSSEKAKASARFFKTKEGEYGFGDTFLGLTVPQSRIIAKKYAQLPLASVIELLHSSYHEERLISLLILINQFVTGDTVKKKEIFELYLNNTAWINNWDLIDTSADKIVGNYLVQKYNRQDAVRILERLARSDSMWERRIAMLSTFAYIAKGESTMTLHIAKILLHDSQDLIHKAVGWLLREVGKRVSETDEKNFLDTHYKTMPRTMLRYAIERFSSVERAAYLLGQR